MTDNKGSQNAGQNQPPQTPSFTLSAQDLKILSARFGRGHSYPNSAIGLTDDRTRQLAEHFISET